MERGQASLEYVAVAAVVAVVLVAGGALAGAGAVPQAVASQVHRAYCLVAGGDCLGPGGPRPCVVRTRDHTREKRLKAVVARLGDGRTVLREDRSDGTVAVTLVDMAEATGGPKAPVKVEIGGKGVGALVGGQLGGRLTAGRRWIVADDAAAKRLVDRLEKDGAPVGAVGREMVRFLMDDAGGANERFARFGGVAEASAVIEGLGIGGVRAEGLASLALGVRIDRATGHRTFELAGDRELFAQLAAPLARVAGGLDRDIGVDLETGPGGTPVALTVRRTAEVHGEVRFGGTRASGGDRLEAEARLDLADPGARALVAELVGRARHADPAAFRAAARLAGRLAGQARIDVRLYATKRAERRGGGSLFDLGYETSDRTETGRLIAATGREPGQGWARRIDCVGVA